MIRFAIAAFCRRINMCFSHICYSMLASGSGGSGSVLLKLNIGYWILGHDGQSEINRTTVLVRAVTENCLVMLASHDISGLRFYRRVVPVVRKRRKYALAGKCRSGFRSPLLESGCGW